MSISICFGWQNVYLLDICEWNRSLIKQFCLPLTGLGNDVHFLCFSAFFQNKRDASVTQSVAELILYSQKTQNVVIFLSNLINLYNTM